MAKQLSEEHIKAMQAGKKKAAAGKRRAAVRRVLDYQAWNRADAQAMARNGSMLPIPVCPSDTDYAIAREEGAIT